MLDENKTGIILKDFSLLTHEKHQQFLKKVSTLDMELMSKYSYLNVSYKHNFKLF